mgnify:CR=1 FL=1
MLNYEEKIKFYLKYIIHLEIYGDLRYTLNILMLLWKECFNVRIRYSMQNALSEQGLKTFKAYYCGLCKAIGKRCSQSARLGLSYDITFLAIVLSSVCKKEISMKDKKCVLHPIRENICVENDTTLNYAADMGVILTYLKLLDDWNDDKSIKALFSMLLFAKRCQKS